MIGIDYPPTPRGTPEEQINQLYKYLFRLAEVLNQTEKPMGVSPNSKLSGTGGAYTAAENT